jgi:D-lactate dehydrogenase
MKIVVFEAEPDEQAAFEQLTLKHELIFAREPLRVGYAHQYERAEILSTFIYSELGSATLGLFRALKLIATRSTGYDHIDLAYCASRNITVCNVPSYGENTVAEHVFALLLAISHHLIDAVTQAGSSLLMATKRTTPRNLEPSFLDATRTSR